jgi:hypothetical protein
VCRQLPDGAEAGLLHPLGGSSELQILVHALAKSGAHEWVFSNRGRKTRLETTLAPPLWYVAGERARDVAARSAEVALERGWNLSCRAAAYSNRTVV